MERSFLGILPSSKKFIPFLLDEAKVSLTWLTLCPLALKELALILDAKISLGMSLAPSAVAL